MPLDDRIHANPFGISDLWLEKDEALDRLLERLVASGARWVRMPVPYPLSDDERRHCDSLIERFQKNNLQVLAVLGGAWTSQTPADFSVPEPAQFRTFVDEAGARWGAFIRHWEIWHQPDDPRCWPAAAGASAYGALLRAASEAIKMRDAGANVHLGGLGHALPKFLQQLYALGLGDTFDRVNIHPFLNPLMPDAVGGLEYFYRMALSAMQAAGDGAKGIWISHLGCPGLSDPRAARDWRFGKNPSELHQAEWVRVLYERALRWPNVEKIFWSAFIDRPGQWKNGEDFCGLLRADAGAKPAFTVYQSAAKEALLTLNKNV